jgi:CRISPR/Cas system CSM-associated protein Csm3 (group 7 of RAMP superfamily)
MKNILTFDMQSFWHIGTGVEGGAYADALTLKNNSGLPYLPGKSIKGLLREAFRTANENAWFDTEIKTLENVLFGSEERSGVEAQGLLQFTNAQLSVGETAHFVENSAYKKNLYKVISSTAIEKKTGVAKEASLRNIEVCIPMTLHAYIEVNTSHPTYQKYSSEFTEKLFSWIENALSLVTEVGAKRHRGLGQTNVTLSQVTGE